MGSADALPPSPGLLRVSGLCPSIAPFPIVQRAGRDEGQRVLIPAGFALPAWAFVQPAVPD